MYKKKLTNDHYVEVNAKLSDLRYRLACLEREKDNMQYEVYVRERSTLNHKIECLEARIEGKWKKATETYNCKGYE